MDHAAQPDQATGSGVLGWVVLGSAGSFHVRMVENYSILIALSRFGAHCFNETTKT
jgi:hypothetical protein